ncbi:hypothetical protein [Flavobacterium sp.]|uniref:hypothetical protein n=1 Tax=Flavobacterium sp. TaxID=239 RepID=UPI003D136269
MKKLVLITLLACGVAFTGFAQDKKEKCKKSKHECKEQCKDGKHVYNHGEKKHKCKKECEKPKA